MTPAELAAIRQRADKATPGPWEIDHECVSGMIPGHRGPIRAWIPGLLLTSANADFIAHARSDVPALLAALDETTRERDEARTLLDGMRGDALVQALDASEAERDVETTYEAVS